MAGDWDKIFVLDKKDGVQMDCRTAEGMVNSYIEHKLPVDELEDFLDHIQECSSCYDELETYFIVHEVMQQLDDNSRDSVLDFKDLMEQDIQSSRRYIRRKKWGWALIGSGICVVIAALAALLVYLIL